MKLYERKIMNFLLYPVVADMRVTQYCKDNRYKYRDFFAYVFGPE